MAEGGAAAWDLARAAAALVVAEGPVRQLGNFRYILIPEINNTLMTNISDPVRAKHVHVFKLNFK
jgi:hypothetical protein